MARFVHKQSASLINPSESRTNTESYGKLQKSETETVEGRAFNIVERHSGLSSRSSRRCRCSIFHFTPLPDSPIFYFHRLCNHRAITWSYHFLVIISLSKESIVDDIWMSNMSHRYICRMRKMKIIFFKKYYLIHVLFSW